MSPRSVASWWRTCGVWQACAVAAILVTLLLLRRLRPAMFHGDDDKRDQYVPVLRDIGLRLRAGDYPVLDPDLGPSGNYAFDPQYGVHDPMHLSVGYLLSFVEDVHLAGWLVSVPFLLLLAWGTTALVLRLGVVGVWSAVAGAGAATSGYVFFKLGATWWPGLVGAAFLPWVWWAWVGRLRVTRVLAITGFTYLVVASGWPSAWFALAILMAALGLEAVLGAGHHGAGPLGWAARFTAATAGAVLGAVHVAPLTLGSDWTVRGDALRHGYIHTVNWADVLAFGVPYLHGDLVSYHRDPTTELPIFFAGWFMLGLAWLTVWRPGIWRGPGVITAGAGLLLALVSTQLPSALGPVRVPARQLAAVQFFGLVWVVLVWARSQSRLSTPRVWGVGLSYGAMALLAWSRTPDESEVYVGIIAGAVALAALLGAWRRLGVHAAGVWALVATACLTCAAALLEHPATTPAGTPRLSDLSAGPGDRPAVALYPSRTDTEPYAWAESGAVGWGFAGLDPGNRYAPGYSSVSHRQLWRRLGIHQAAGTTPVSAVRALFEEDPATGRTWIQLLGYRTVLVHRTRVAAFERHAGDRWTRVAASDHFVKYAERREPADTGRVTAVLGEVDVSPVRVAGERQEYHVRTREGGTLVFRDLYWPGYAATLDGRRLAVEPHKRTLVGVTLPPGAAGTLVVTFRAHAPATLAATLGGGAALLLTALGLARASRRREEGVSREVQVK